MLAGSQQNAVLCRSSFPIPSLPANLDEEFPFCMVKNNSLLQDLSLYSCGLSYFNELMHGYRSSNVKLKPLSLMVIGFLAPLLLSPQGNSILRKCCIRV